MDRWMDRLAVTPQDPSQPHHPASYSLPDWAATGCAWACSDEPVCIQNGDVSREIKTEEKALGIDGAKSAGQEAESRMADVAGGTE